MSKTPKESRSKSHAFQRWLFFLVISILLGTTAALLPLASPDTLQMQSFEMPNLLRRIIFFTCAFLIAFYLLILIFKISRRFWCWLFSWRNLKRALIGFAFLSLLVALFYVEENIRGKWDWDNYKRELEAKGEKFDFASFIPPPVPDGQNFALTPIVSGCYGQVLDRRGNRIQPPNTNVVDRLEMSISDESLLGWPTNGSGFWWEGTKIDLKVWQQYYRALSAKTNEFPVLPQPQTPAADVLLALSKYDSTIEELRRASQLPYSRFPLDYTNKVPAEILLPHLSALKQCSQVLQLRATAELENGQSEKSLADINLMLRLTDSIRSEPFLISHLVRLIVLEMALQPIWEGLAEHKWSDTQLVDLEQELGKLDILADLQFSMRSDRAGEIGTVEYMRQHRNYLELFFDNGDSNDFSIWDDSFNWRYRIMMMGFYLKPDGWFYESELAIAQVCQHWYLPIIDVQQQLVSPEIGRQADEFLASWKSTPMNVIAKMMLPALNAAAMRFAREQISVDMARTACALERYRLAHGEYPESLDALLPQFISKLPHDIIGGQPLHYRRTSDGQFVLYSVGWNEKDDGGVLGYLPHLPMPSFELGDWVWQYPTK
jgi:hypothetical protein